MSYQGKPLTAPSSCTKSWKPTKHVKRVKDGIKKEDYIHIFKKYCWSPVVSLGQNSTDPWLGNTGVDAQLGNEYSFKKRKTFFLLCLPPGFLPVVGPTEWWCLRHLSPPCYVALGQALICGYYQETYCTPGLG